MKNLAILGSTGSVGASTLDVVRGHPGRFRVLGLTTYGNIRALAGQIEEFTPEVVSVYDEGRARELRRMMGRNGLRVLSGQEGNVAVATWPRVDQTVLATLSIAGLRPALAAVAGGIDLALANKEVLVVGGALLREASRQGGAIIPIDSEHSGLFQALDLASKPDVEALVLTASGGPFRSFTQDELQKVSAQQALQHPVWKMGRKISIDSATLMNKGFEVIEAHWLFNFQPDRISVVIHPQSVVHAMVRFLDGTLLAHMGVPDMRIPIAYALHHPRRLANRIPPLDLTRIGSLTFEEPDLLRFPCLQYAYDALDSGGTMPAVLNAANDVAVNAFIEEAIKFTDIPRVIAAVMASHQPHPVGNVDEVLEADLWARSRASEQVTKYRG